MSPDNATGRVFVIYCKEAKTFVAGYGGMTSIVGDARLFKTAADAAKNLRGWRTVTHTYQVLAVDLSVRPDPYFEKSPNAETDYGVEDAGRVA